MAEPLLIPAPALIVLAGPGASGKSTWAAIHFDPGAVVSSDALRAAVGDGEHDLTASADAFWLVGEIVRRRLGRRLTTVIDSLGSDPDQRESWRRLAADAGVPCIAVVFDTPPAECRRRNAARPVPIPAQVLRRQLQRWPAELDVLRTEPWHAVLPARTIAQVPATLAPALAPALAPGSVAPTRSGGDVPVATSAGASAAVGVTSPGATVGPPIGLHLSVLDGPGGRVTLPDRLGAIAAAAEAAGVAHLWVMDHLRQIPQVGPAWQDLPEPYTTLAWLAARTERVRLGTLVSPAFLRPVAVTAKLVATLDVLSGGRAVCGLGVGWFEQEYRAAGLAFPPLAERYAHLADALCALPVLWGPGAPEFIGRVNRLPETLAYPRPIQPRIPIWVGGSGPRTTLRLVAQYADGCNLFGEPDVVAERVATLDRHCAAIGRDRRAITVTQLSTVLIGRDRAEVATLVERLRPRRWSAERFAAHVNAGTVDDHRRRIERFAAAGVDELIVRLADIGEPGAIERLGALVAAVNSPR